MKSIVKKFFLIILLWCIFWSFYVINGQNYITIKTNKYALVEHPEFLPTPQIAKATSFWFSNLRADWYWLETIQYIWGNAIWSQYKKYLFEMIDIITDLNPFFEKPYLIGQLLLPSYNENYEDLSSQQLDEYNKKAEILWLKWMQNFCDEEKMQQIFKENDLTSIWNEQKYSNPCKSMDLPFGQWFLYYFYLKDPLKSAQYYKVASANKDALEWARIMSAIMSGKGWEREKSIIMFLTLADSTGEKNEVCEVISNEIQWLAYGIFQEWIPLTWQIMEALNMTRKQYFDYNEDLEQQVKLWDNCSNYINKSVREFNLYYIELADKKYLEEKGEHSRNAKQLFEEWYLEYLPIDFQQYTDYGIIYYFNDETNNYDYKMWE